MLEPAEGGTGLVFVRDDLAGKPSIQAVPGNIVESERCTSLAGGGATVRTVEHVLAACRLAILDNAVIRVTGEELPAADGSAAEYLAAISEAGLTEQYVRIPAPGLSAPLVCGDRNGRRIEAEPAPGAFFTYKFAPPGPLAGREASYEDGKDDPRATARSRTFCFEAEIRAIIEAGLGRGGNADNVLVLKPDGSPLNGARSGDEPARHKLLDLVGDLAIAGLFHARVTAVGTGHRQNAEFVRMLTAKLAVKEA